MDKYLTNYAILSDAETIQTVKIQQAIDECASTGGGTVFFQPGIYRSGTLEMRSGVYLHLPAGATLKASGNKEDYNAPDAWPQNGASPREHTNGGHFIVFHEVENCGITGHGTIDGNGMAFGYRRDLIDVDKAPLELKRPSQMVWLCESRNIRLRDVELVNSAYWSCLVIGCSDVIISGLKIKNNPEIPNSDGLDIDSSRNVIVSDCLIDTEDDCITFRCDKSRLKNQNALLENVTVTNCQLRTPGCNAFRIGVGNGIIRDCCVSNCIIRGSSKGVCMEARYTFNTDDRPGCNIENIQFNNIFMESICPIFISSYCLGLYDVPAPAIRNIRFTNMVIYGQEQIVVQSNKKSVVEGITFSGVTLEISGSPAIQKSYGYSEWNHATNLAAFYLANAKDVTMRDLSVRVVDANSPIEAITIQDNCQPYMDNVKGFRQEATLPVVIQNPCVEYMAERFIEWANVLEQSFQIYGIDEQGRTEMRAFLEAMKTMPAQCMLLENLYKYPGSLDEIYINAAFDADNACRFRLLVLLLYAPTVEENYRKAGYPEGLWKDILGDLMVWLPKMREDLGFTGVTARIGEWILCCQNAQVIQMGRVQCEMSHKFNQPYAVFRENGQYVVREVSKDAPRNPDAILQYGDAVINLHIPATGPLKKEDCIASIKRMKQLKSELGGEYRAFVCYSWLLSDALQKLLPEKSNIRDFASLGHHLPNFGEQTNEIKWRLWNRNVATEGIANAPRDTSLRRNVATYLENGGRFQEGAFFILAEEI